MKKKLSEKNKENFQTSEVKRYLGILHEDYSSKLDLIIEQFDGINEKFDGVNEKLDEHTSILQSHTEMIGNIAEDVEIIKNDIEFLKGGMKKKVDYDEFIALERRLSLLESKAKR